MTRNELRLLRAFGWSALAAACAIAAFLGIERLSGAERSLRAIEAATSKLEGGGRGEAGIEERIATLRSALGPAAGLAPAMSLPEYGAALRARLASRGIEPLRYQVVGPKGAEAIEYTLSCPVSSFLRFLAPSAGERAPLDVAFLSVRASPENGSADIVIRIRYAK